MSTIDYMTRVRARCEEFEARRKLEAQVKSQQQQACIDGFCDFVEAWNQVKDTQVPNLRRFATTETVSLNEHRKQPYPGQEHFPVIEFRLWNGDTGPQFRCLWDEDVGAIAYMYSYADKGAKRMTKDQLMETFITTIAERMVKKEQA
jgi:hypothetical protein